MTLPAGNATRTRYLRWLCGSCHGVHTRRVDPVGVDDAIYHVETYGDLLGDRREESVMTLLKRIDLSCGAPDVTVEMEP